MKLLILVCFLWKLLTVLGSPSLSSNDNGQRQLEGECRIDATTIAGSFLFDFVGRPDQLAFADEVDVLGSTVLESYNSASHCKRSLSSFALETDTSDFAVGNTSVEQEQSFSLLFSVQGSCEDSVSCQEGGRLLFDAQDPCGCIGPSARLFQLDLRERLDPLVANGSLTSVTSLVHLAEIVDQPDCPAITTDMSSSSVVVEFFGCLVPAHINQLGALFRDTYNALNSLDTQFCDPSFRQIASVSVSLDAAFVASGRRRNLQENSDCTDPQQFALRFDADATCRGCDPSSGVTLFDRVDEGNQAISMAHNERRFLQSGDASSCRCPATPVLRAITQEEMAQAFGAALSSKIDLMSIERVVDLIEVEPVTCIGESNNTFETFLEIVWETPAGSVSQAVIDGLAEQCRISYNNLANRFCDPQFRRMISVEIFTPPTEARRELQLFLRPFALVYRIVFACPFCPQESNLFDDAGRRRLSTSNNMMVRQQSMQEEDDPQQQCYCAAVNGIGRAATEREFLARYRADFILRFPGGRITGLQEVDPIIIDNDEARADGRDACETSSDCDPKETGDLCVASQCIFDGNPRITLTWDGNTDYDLYCTTPENVTISFETTFDPSSNGAFDTGYVQTVNGSHVESIYFPIDGSSPGGDYVCRVDEFDNRGSSDEWTIEVSAGKAGIILSQSGTGSRSDITFRQEDEAAPEDCDTEKPDFDCCLDTDCPGTGDMCTNFRCIQDGQPRFTLTWYGDDFLRLYVFTPGGSTISALHQADVTTGGTYQEEPKFVVEPTFHTQSVYFPVSAPPGEYIFFVDSAQQNGVADSWELTTSQQVDIETFTGTGRSAYFSLFHDPPTEVENRECFSGAMTVVTQDRGRIFMKDLKVGDLVASANGRFERVYSFGHRSENQVSTYLLLDPVGLEVSKNHMVFLESGRAVPASALKVGDLLLDGQEIASIRSVQRRGAYAPFTSSGTILVNKVAASTYVAFQDSDVLVIGGVETPFSFQWMAHTSQLPHRMWCCLQGSSEDRYTAEGISTWVHTPLVFTEWWLQQKTVLMALVALPLVCILGAFALLEEFIQHSSEGLTGLAMAWMIYQGTRTRKDKGYIRH